MSSDNQTRNGHGRQLSEVSELSNGTETTNDSYELDDTSPQSIYDSKFGLRSNEYGYASLHNSGNINDKRSLSDGVKSKVQDWVGMTGLSRKPSRRRDEGLGLRNFNHIPSPTTSNPNPSSTTPSTPQEQGKWGQLRGGMDSPLPGFARYVDKGRLEAIDEALRESGTTVSTDLKVAAEGFGEVSDSRAQIARMELKRVDSDLTPVEGRELRERDGGFEKDLVV